MGEVYGGEALDMLQVMTTGYDGSMFSIHGIGPHDVLQRLETMVAMNNLILPLLTVRQMIANALHLITYQERMADGKRRIVKITEVAGMQGDTIALHDLFEFRDMGVDDEGQVQGYFTATGHVPSFLERFRASHIRALLQAERIDLPLSLFEPKE
jgi:pilus assembly protein CpaF